MSMEGIFLFTTRYLQRVCERFLLILAISSVFPAAVYGVANVDVRKEVPWELKSELPPEAKQAVEVLIASVEVPETSMVLLVGPVPPGTIIREEVRAGEKGVELLIPKERGTYYVFFINDKPGFKYAHPVRYAFVRIEDRKVDVREASFPMTMYPPEQEPRPFRPVALETIKGIQCVYGEGEFAGQPTKELPAGKQADVPPPGCRKTALVFDGGDRGWFICDTAKEMARDANSIAEWLEGEGWEVIRRSQYRGNAHTYFPSSRGFFFRIKEIGRDLKETNRREGIDEVTGCCHEFFLYINARGAETGTDMYNPRDGKYVGYIGYEDVLNELTDFPKNVKFTIFVDACQSGGIIDELEQDAIVSPEPIKEKLCGRCGLTILTSTDVIQSAESGKGFYDSGTEDFMEGASRDYDGDGKKGDIHDRFEEMKAQGVDQQPESFHCPEGTSWCSLD